MSVQPISASLPPTFEPVGRADTDSWISVVHDVVKFANVIAETDFAPKGLRGSAPAVAAAMLYGREVGLPPMTALSATHVVDGRPAISAEAMRALVFAAGHEIAFDVQTGAECTLRGRRRGSDQWTTVSWSLAMARAAGLLNRPTWQRYPRAMLTARATAELCRLLFPDVIHGFAAVEEIDDAAGSPQTAAGSPDAQSPAPAPVRRRRATVGSRGRSARPAGPPTRPGGQPAPDEAPALPGDPGFEDSSTTTRVDDTGGNTAPDTGDTLPVSGVATDTDSAVAPPTPAGSVAGGGEDPQDPPPALDKRPPVAPRMITRPQQRMLIPMLAALGVDTHEDRVDVLTVLTGRTVTSSTELSAHEASQVIDTLGPIDDADQLAELCSALIATAAQADDAADDAS